MATTTAPGQAKRELEQARRELEQAKRELEQAKTVIERQKLRIEGLLEEKCEALVDLEQFKKGMENWKRKTEAAVRATLNREKEQETQTLRLAMNQEVVNLRREMEEREYNRRESLRKALDKVEEQRVELETFKEQAESRTAEIAELLRMKRLERGRVHELNHKIYCLERLSLRNRELDIAQREEIERLREAQCLNSWEKKDLKNMMSGLFLLSEDQKGTEGETADMPEVDYMRLTEKLMKIYRSNGFNLED
jgi:chromosome segregation ATPase